VNRGIGAAVWEFEISSNEHEVTKIIQGAIADTHDSVVWNKPVSLSDPLGTSSSPQVAVILEEVLKSPNSSFRCPQSNRRINQQLIKKILLIYPKRC